MKRKPESLTVADLPGVDPGRFDEWKSLHRRARQAPLFGLLVYASTFITVPVIGGAIGWALPIVFWFVYMFAYVAPLAAAERKRAAELGVAAALGLTEADVARAARTRKVAKVVGLSMIGLLALAAAGSLLMARGSRRSVSAEPTDAMLTESFPVVWPDHPEGFVATRVRPRFFEMVAVYPYVGTFFGAADYDSTAASVVVISHHAWQTLFHSDLSVLGRVILINSREHTVVGIAPPAFQVPGRTDFWVPGGSAR